ncbi:MAG: hypothetical protein LBK82_06990 [Planctomycetaceae bacterium]|nr:hypothetical protein [Planctomycetaceae bacterium]
MGDLSLKGRVGDSRLASVSKRKSVILAVWGSDFHPSTGASCLSATQRFSETSPTC